MVGIQKDRELKKKQKQKEDAAQSKVKQVSAIIVGTFNSCVLNIKIDAMVVSMKAI